ncbi:MAG: DUF4325 domain-containing protein [Patescibacteria group bacterium]
MDLKEHIFDVISKKRTVSNAELSRQTGFSRVYIHRFLKALCEEGRIVLVGRANKARYVLATKKAVLSEKSGTLSFRRAYRIAGLTEDAVLADIKHETGIYQNMAQSVARIADFAFTKMLNNALEHSHSKTVDVYMMRDAATLRFDIRDRGIGIYRNLMQTHHFDGELDAIHQLLKGKVTTAPRAHTGEGIFFTSKLADVLVIESGTTKLTFHTLLDDIFITKIKTKQGTRVSFSLSLHSKRMIEKVFHAYTDSSYHFSKTNVRIKLYALGVDYISRSQARRLLVGLEKFQEIILDFKDVQSIGQAFADEIFRVWQRRHSAIRLTWVHAEEAVKFMIKRALHEAE